MGSGDRVTVANCPLCRRDNLPLRRDGSFRGGLPRHGPIEAVGLLRVEAYRLTPRTGATR